MLASLVHRGGAWRRQWAGRAQDRLGSAETVWLPRLVDAARAGSQLGRRAGCGCSKSGICGCIGAGAKVLWRGAAHKAARATQTACTLYKCAARRPARRAGGSGRKCGNNNNNAALLQEMARQPGTCKRGKASFGGYKQRRAASSHSKSRQTGRLGARNTFSLFAPSSQCALAALKRARRRCLPAPAGPARLSRRPTPGMPQTAGVGV